MNTPTPSDKEWEAKQRFASLLQQPKIVTHECYEEEELLCLIADKSNTPNAAQMWAHISGCAHCAAEFAALSNAYQMAGNPRMTSYCRFAWRLCRSAYERSKWSDMEPEHWTVLIVAWLGWGFNMFDATLFTHVAHNCISTLLHLPFDLAETDPQVLQWKSILTSALLLSWAVGGVLFGWVADKIGRARTMMLTILLYALGTACCAFAPNIWILLLFRVISGLGIGGEWAAGASIVAEKVPEARRVQAGILLYTAAPIGLFLATFVNAQIAGNLGNDLWKVSWRYVLLCGLLPAAFAFPVSRWVEESGIWITTTERSPKPRVSELFKPEIIRATRSGLLTSLMALIPWWSCYTFIPDVVQNLTKDSTTARLWKGIAANNFHWGGLLGILLLLLAAKYMSRRSMFFMYFGLSAIAWFVTFGMGLRDERLLRMYFVVGLTLFGVFGSFTFYLPELFPTRLRATGAGFCYNIGRILAAVGTFWFGHVATGGLDAMLRAMCSIIVVLILGLFLLPWIVDTHKQTLAQRELPQPLCSG